MKSSFETTGLDRDNLVLELESAKNQLEIANKVMSIPGNPPVLSRRRRSVVGPTTISITTLSITTLSIRVKNAALSIKVNMRQSTLWHSILNNVMA
jgi:hypothetical protein